MLGGYQLKGLEMRWMPESVDAVIERCTGSKEKDSHATHQRVDVLNSREPIAKGEEIERQLDYLNARLRMIWVGFSYRVCYSNSKKTL